MAKAVLQKNWYELVAPDLFDNETVGETPAEEDNLVGDRTIKVNLKDVMSSTDKYYMDVFLQVEETEGSKAHTRIAGHTISKEYLSKMIGRYSNRVDAVEDVETQDSEAVRVKVVATTIKKTHSSTVKDIRKKIREMVQDRAGKQDLESFMESIFTGELQDELVQEGRKIYPLRELEVRKTEVQ